MTLDDAGFRTLDSVVRAKKVFRAAAADDHHGSVSQLPRRVPSAALRDRRRGVPVARSRDLRSSAKSRVRELLADVKACLDLYVLHTRPRFLGDPIVVRVAGR